MISTQNNIEQLLFSPGKYFLIPEFQRPYSWEAENVRSFLDDLESLVDTNKKHFFGSVVYVSEGDASSIIDGQQRVTTVLLMLTAIFHIVEEKPAASQLPAEAIKEKYLFNKYAKNYGGEENSIKLKTVTTDNIVFEKIYNKDELGAKEKQSRLYQAYSLFIEFFNTKENLDRYIEALSRFEIVTIALDASDDNPQRVFESINSTGKPLTDGDKIRNFALMLNRNDDRTYVINKYWNNIEAPLTDASKDYITDFFRSYIISQRQAVIPLGNVYPEFKKLFAKRISKGQPRDEIDGFYSDILKSLEYYRFLKFGEDVNERFSDINRILFKLRYVQIEIYIPFAMTVLAYYDEGKLTAEELVKVFKLIETYFARRIVCNINTTSVDKLLASLHKDIVELHSGTEESNYVDILSYLLLSRSGATRLPLEGEVKTAIQNNQTYNQRKTYVNFILTSVDDQSKESSLLKQIQDKETKLTIEHIMPQKLSEGWKKELGENYEIIQERYLHTLSNLTLTGYNSELSNRSFTEKKSMSGGFNDSPLVINREVKKTDTWDEDTLKHREKWWITQLNKIWPVPTTTFKPVKIDTEVFLLDDIDLKGAKVRVLHLLGDSIPVTSWAQALDVIVERAFELDEELYDKIIQDDWLARYIRTDDTILINPMQINDLELYIESGIDTNYKRKIIGKVANIMGWVRTDVTVELVEPLNREGSPSSPETTDEAEVE